MRISSLSVEKAAQIYRLNSLKPTDTRSDSRSSTVKNPGLELDSVHFSHEALEKARLLTETKRKETGQEQREKQGQDDQTTRSLRVLNLDSNASLEEIRRAYHYLMSRYHPDKYEQSPREFRELAEARSKQIIEAYRVLSKRDFQGNG